MPGESVRADVRADVRAVIFDCDGTLVDSELIGLEVMQDEARKLGVDFAPGEDLLHLRGRSMSSNLATLAQRLGRPLPDDFEAQLRRAMAEVFRARLVPMPGAARVVRELRVPSCVASNGPRNKTELTLSLTGLLPHFQGRIFSAFEVGSFKPEPGLFLAAAQAMGVPPRHCAVVEDSLPGLHAAVAAGMSAYAVRAELELPAQLVGHVRWLDRLEDLLDEPWHRP